MCQSTHPLPCERSRVAILMVGSVLLIAAPLAAQQVDRTIQNTRSYTIPNVGPIRHAAATGKVKSFAIAVCEHGLDDESQDDSGKYLEITNPPVNVVATQRIATSDAQVAHAYAYASSVITPETTLNGNQLTVTVTELSRTFAHYWECPYGPSYATAWATANTDPIVFGSAQYTSYSGGLVDPFPPEDDGVHRYVEQTITLKDGSVVASGLPGPSKPIPSPYWGPGQSYVNTWQITQYVQPFADDDPDNDGTSGVLVYQLTANRVGNGAPVVVWTPGSGTAQFAFTFSQTPAQIEQNVEAYLAGGADLSLGTVRITMLQDDVTLPNMTLVGGNRTEAWVYHSNNPYQVDWPIKWWQSPDTNALYRPSICVSGPLPEIRADDFLCQDGTPIAAVRWWGTYAGETGTHRADTGYTLPFTIRIYDSDGAPHPTSLPLTGPPLVEYNVLASRYFISWMMSNDALYEYGVCLPTEFNQQAGHEYFIAICDASDPDWNWVDATTNQLDGPAVSNSSTGPWSPDPFPDLAFALMTGPSPDFDADGDVDGTDFLRFLNAWGGAMNPTPDPAADFDCDLDVDLSDFLNFSLAYTGPQNLGSVNTSPVSPLGTVTLTLQPAASALTYPGGTVDYEIWAYVSAESDGLYGVVFDVLTGTGQPQNPAGLTPPPAFSTYVYGGTSIGDDLAGASAFQNPYVVPTTGFGQGAPVQIASGTTSTFQLPRSIGPYTVSTAAGGAAVVDQSGLYTLYPPADLIHGGFTIDVVIDCDHDNDGDVDLTDYGAFLDCYNGPNNPPASTCVFDNDFDRDGDVDLSDYGGFLTCYNGPARPPTLVLHCTTSAP
jgi:hypothetical protein